MPNVPTLSTVPASLEAGFSRPALQSASEGQPSFADALDHCIGVPGMADVVEAKSAEVSAGPGDIVLSLPVPLVLSGEVGQPAVTVKVDGESLSAPEPVRDETRDEPILPSDLVAVGTEQAALLPPLVLPMSLLELAAVASAPVDRHDELCPISDTVEGQSRALSARAAPTQIEPRAEQVADTAEPVNTDKAAADDGSSRAATPTVATDFQQSPALQQAANQSAVAQIPFAPPTPSRPHETSAAATRPSLVMPMQQVMPLIASVAVTRDGAPKTLVIRLDPAELGRVQIHIERTVEGLSHISLQAERPDTLQLLVRDQPQLHRALDLAGVPSDGRVLQFQLAPDQSPLTQGFSQFGASGSGSGFASPDGRGHAGQRSSGQNNGYASTANASETLSVPNRRLAGVDITA